MQVSGKLHIEIQRISGCIPASDHSLDSQSESSNESSSGYEGLEDHEPEGGLAVGAPLTCRVRTTHVILLYKVMVASD